MLVNALGDRPLRAVQKSKNNPAEMWKRLHDRYATKSSASRIQLQTELHAKKLRPQEELTDFIDGFESLFTLLASMDHAIEEDMQVAMLLASLSSEKDYEHVVAALKTLPQEKLTWDTVSARLIDESKQRRHKRSGSMRQGSEKLRSVRRRAVNSLNRDVK